MTDFRAECWFSSPRVIKENKEGCCAYQNRISVVATPDGRSNDHTLAESRTLRNVTWGLSDDQIIIADPYVEQPNVASVTNSHEYRDLVYESLLIPLQMDFNPSDIQEAMKEILQHEYEHHVPGLGRENLEIRYCMSFLEDEARKTVGVQPFINVSGAFELRISEK